MRPALRRLPARLFLGVMMIGSLLITAASFVYFDSENLAPFVIEKLPVRFERLWMLALVIHVPSALLSLPACLLLMTRSLQKRRSIHRLVGRATGVLVLLALVPSGGVLALEAKGGLWASVGFLLSGGIVFCAMSTGIVAARRGAHVAHARAMRHVVAQMSVAVSSRAMLIALDAGGVDPEAAYLWALWIPVVASALVAELLSGGRRHFDYLSVFSPSRSLS